MAFLDFGDPPDAGIELFERCLARVRQLDLGEGDVVEAELRRVDDGAISRNNPRLDEVAQPDLARGLRQPDGKRQVGHGDTSVRRKHGKDFSVE